VGQAETFKLTLEICSALMYNDACPSAGVMELADVRDSKSTSSVHLPACATPDKYLVFEN